MFLLKKTEEENYGYWINIMSLGLLVASESGCSLYLTLLGLESNTVLTCLLFKHTLF